MSTKTLTIDYDEYEDMKLRLKVLEESKLCTLHVSFGYRSGMYFSISGVEELKVIVEDTIAKYKSDINEPLKLKIYNLEKQLAIYTATKEEIKLELGIHNETKWYQFWK